MAKGKDKGKGKDKKRKKNRKGPPLAERADKYDLYQRSVQEPSCEVEFFDEVYRELNGRSPKLLREDFCGTFAVSCEWVRKRGRHAIVVDLDPEPLTWGREHNLAALPPKAQDRLEVRQADVRSVSDPQVDILAAQNFSFWIFTTREELREYFEVARRSLADDGLLVLDMMGGGECYRENSPEERKLDGFRYLWEMVEFDPVSNLATHNIHFRFKDGSKLERAFEYSWRFWTIPEVREVLAEAGFEDSTVYWEGTDDDKGEGDGKWAPAKRGTCDPSWIAYIVARP